MALLAKLRRDQLEARKAKDAIKVGLLTTLISESSMIGKNDGNRETTELEVVQMIKKFLKNTEETLATTKLPADALVQYLVEKDILLSYLPRQMDLDELRARVLEIIATVEKSPKSMGVVMKELRSKFEGQYDGAMASQLVREELSK